VPIGFIWWALPPILRARGLAVDEITALTAAVTVPWVLKFLVGPVIDASRARGIRSSTWIVGCQTLMGLALLPLVSIDLVDEYDVLFGCLVAHAVFAATQDVAIDALAIRSVPPDELGAISGVMQAGMTVGRAATAAAVPLLLEVVSQLVAVLAIVALIWLPLALLVLASREPYPARRELDGGGATFSWAFLAERRMWIAAAVALTVAAAFEAVGALAGPLLVDAGSSTRAIALFYGLSAPAALLIGALVGGHAADRFGPVRTVVVSVIFVALSVGGCALLAALEAGGEMPHWQVALPVVYAAAGLLTASSYALFMHVSRGPSSASRFSALMAMTNGCEAWSAFAAGRLVAASGYPAAFGAMAVASLVSLPLLRLMARQKE
jgi:PAT family beta-lactamase induction signal transducer AmpG